MKFTSLDSPYTVLQSPDVLLILGNHFHESFALRSLPQLVSVISEVLFPALQAPPEGVKEVISLEQFSSVFNLPGPSCLCNYLNLSLLLVQILSPVPKVFLSSRLLLVPRPTSVAAGRSSAISRLLPGLIAPP